MQQTWSSLIVPFLMIAATSALGEQSRIVGAAPGQILAGGVNRVMILSQTGGIIWEYPAKLVHDAWMLPSGNVLFADGESVKEVTRDKKVVFEYKSAASRGGGTYACQRLTNGNTLIGENSTGKILEATPAGNIVFSLQTEPFKVGEHQNLRMARKLDNGNYLVCQSGARTVKEYAPDGRVVWESRQPGSVAFAALRTAKGTTFASSLDQVIEYDATGAKIWECSIKDLDVPVRNLTGMHLQPNGNIVLGCYSAYKDGAGCTLLEISREKKVLWRYANPTADSSMMAVQLLTADGKPLEDPCLR